MSIPSTEKQKEYASLILTILIILFSIGYFKKNYYDKWAIKTKAEEAQKAQRRAIALLNPPTVDSVTPDRLGGKIIRSYNKRKDVFPIKQVKANSPTQFWVTYKNGYGDEGYLRYDAGIDKEKGRWEGGNGDVGSFTIHRSDGDHKYWNGTIADDVAMTKSVDTLTVELEVVR